MTERGKKIKKKKSYGAIHLLTLRIVWGEEERITGTN